MKLCGRHHAGKFYCCWEIILAYVQVTKFIICVGLYIHETSQMRSFAKIKFSRNGVNTLRLHSVV